MMVDQKDKESEDTERKVQMMPHLAVRYVNGEGNHENICLSQVNNF